MFQPYLIIFGFASWIINIFDIIYDNSYTYDSEIE